MNDTIRKHIIKQLDKGFRLDGRKPDEYREITIEYGVSATAEGSAKVSFGDTTVIAGVKLGLESPYSDTPEEGNLMVNAELLPLSSPLFESGPPGIDAIELARVTDRGIRESDMIDRKKLCVEKGEKVWSVLIDVCSVNHAGNLMDAANLAALAALKDAVYPSIDEDGNPDYKNRTSDKLPLEKLPVSITVHKVGDHLLLDPTVDEEQNAGGRLTVCSLDNGDLCALQKGGEATFTLEEINKMLDMAVARAKESRKVLG